MFKIHCFKVRHLTHSFFDAPLSSEHSLALKITCVALHILTLGIPLLIYRVAHFFSKRSLGVTQDVIPEVIQKSEFGKARVQNLGQMLVSAKAGSLQAQGRCLHHKRLQHLPYVDKVPLVRSPEEQWAEKERSLEIFRTQESLVTWVNQGRELGCWGQPLSYNRNILHVLAMRCEDQSLIVDVLTSGGIDLSEKDQFYNTPLVWALADACNTNALTIIEHAPQDDHLNVQCLGNTALHLSVGKGYTNRSVDGQLLEHSNFEITQALLKRKANPNLQNKRGDTPLHLACLRRDAPSIKALIEAGADLSILNKAGYTPLQMIDLGYREADEILMDTIGKFLLNKSAYHANRDASIKSLMTTQL